MDRIKFSMAPEVLRHLTKQERAAMWLYHDEYAQRGVGAIQFWQELAPYKKDNVDTMIREILEATDEVRDKAIAPTMNTRQQEIRASIRARVAERIAELKAELKRLKAAKVRLQMECERQKG